MSGEHVPQKDYRRHVASILIRSSTISMEVRSPPARFFKVADEIRLVVLDIILFLVQFGNVLVIKSCCNQCEKYLR